MSTLILILLILGAVCFLASAFGVTTGRVHLVSLGLFFWIVTAILARV